MADEGVMHIIAKCESGESIRDVDVSNILIVARNIV
jgi:hypothetical protein